MTLLLGVIIGLLVLLNAISDMLSTGNPRLSLVANPLNSSARINFIASNLNNSNSANNAPDILADANLGMRLEPFDARFYSLAGIINEQAGRVEESRRLYRHSLRLLPTEIQALTRLFNYHSVEGDKKRAVELADHIVRRWPQYREPVAQRLPQLLLNDTAYQAILNRFSAHYGGIKLLTNTLISDTKTLDIAYRVVMDWHNRGVKPLRSAINRLTWALVTDGQYSKAFRLFHLTLGDKFRQSAGYIYNSKFDGDHTDNAFDWRFVSRSGLRLNIRKLPIFFKNDDRKNSRALTIKFSNSPVKLATISQYLKLPSSRMKLNVVYSSRDLKGPNPVTLAIRCTSGILLTSHKLVAGKPDFTRLTSTFIVPDEGCDIQYVNFNNGDFLKFQRNRFSGSLYLHEIAVSLAEG